MTIIARPVGFLNQEFNEPTKLYCKNSTVYKHKKCTTYFKPV